MSDKNKAKLIVITPLAQKEREEFLRRCNKLYFSMLENNKKIDKIE